MTVLGMIFEKHVRAFLRIYNGTIDFYSTSMTSQFWGGAGTILNHLTHEVNLTENPREKVVTVRKYT